MKLNSAQHDRACGVLLGTAAGDALGAPHEFGPPRGPELDVAMVGGGVGWAPGEWTDDTSMAIAIAEVAATGADLRAPEAQDADRGSAGPAGRVAPRTSASRPAGAQRSVGRVTPRNGRALQQPA